MNHRNRHDDRRKDRHGNIVLAALAIMIGLMVWATIASASDTPARKHEAHYVDVWCNSAGGDKEYVLPDRTRVDCLLDDFAVEFDWSFKWAECIGQASFYGEMTSRTSACVLIQHRADARKSFYRFARRAITAAKRANVIVVCIDTDGNEIPWCEKQSEERIDERK